LPPAASIQHSLRRRQRQDATASGRSPAPRITLRGAVVGLRSVIERDFVWSEARLLAVAIFLASLPAGLDQLSRYRAPPRSPCPGFSLLLGLAQTQTALGALGMAGKHQHVVSTRSRSSSAGMLTRVSACMVEVMRLFDSAAVRRQAPHGTVRGRARLRRRT
jgi:hypothetical protein